MRSGQQKCLGRLHAQMKIVVNTVQCLSMRAKGSVTLFLILVDFEVSELNTLTALPMYYLFGSYF